jgi:hypothetical protein
MGAFGGNMRKDLNGESLYQASNIRCEDGATAPVISPLTLTVTTSTQRARATNVATITTAANHGIAVGQTFTISGVTGAAYNGTFVATAGTATTALKYASTGADESTTADTGGSVYPHKTLTPDKKDMYLVLSPSADLRVSENNVMDGSATTKGYDKILSGDRDVFDSADEQPLYIRPDTATCVICFRYHTADEI